MDDVKPCPFCGNAPYVAEEIDPYEWWFVACRTPGCILPIAGGCTSIESAIARWNRRAALAFAPAQQWISVDERLPDCGAWVLATNGKWTGVAAYFTDVVDADEHWQDERREFIEMLGPKVSHWMPLPEAPASSVASIEEPTS